MIHANVAHRAEGEAVSPPQHMITSLVTAGNTGEMRDKRYLVTERTDNVMRV